MRAKSRQLGHPLVRSRRPEHDRPVVLVGHPRVEIRQQAGGPFHRDQVAK
jgi:hypothetical protein